MRPSGGRARSQSTPGRGALLALALVLAGVFVWLTGCADATVLKDAGAPVRTPGSIAAPPASETGGPEAGTPEQPAGEPADPEAPAPDPGPETIAGTVTRVVDGDTAEIRLASGVTEKVRFIGINTPESTTRHEPYGEEASAFTKQRLGGRTVYLETDVELRDKYGRLLAYVWLDPPSSSGDGEVRAKMFNARLLLDGYAEQATYPPNVRYVDLFAVYAREAREEDRGLWALSSAPAPSAAPQPSGPAGASYIGNRNTGKFHYASCSSVGDMNPANKVPLATREQAVSAGYVPCKRCNP